MIVSAVTMLPSDVCGYVESLAMCRAKIGINSRVRATWQIKEGSLWGVL